MKITAEQKEILKSWTRYFVGGFVSIITLAITSNLSKGIIPPVTVDDLLAAFWSAIGATAVVVGNYLNPAYKQYGKDKSK